MITDAPGQSARLFVRVARVLDEHQVPYAAIGAMAAAYYGVVRATLDTDAVISLAATSVSLDTLLAALASEAVSVTYRPGDDSDPLLGVIAVEDDYGNRVDLILGIRGMDESAFSRTVHASLLGTSIRMIGIDDFIAMKLFAGSARDTDDVRHVLDISRELFDEDRVRCLAARYGAGPLQVLEQLLAESAG